MASLPALIRLDGTPMRAAMLTQEIAAPQTMGLRSILSGHPAQGLTPRRLAGLLLAAEQGDAIGYLELAEEMEEKDLHYLSVLGTRKRQVAQLPIEVVAAGDSEEDKADAQLVRDWLTRDLIQTEIFNILDAIGKGFSVTEIIWEFTDATWLPAKLIWRDPRFFEFDRVDGTTLCLRDINGPQPMPPCKFITHYHQAKSGLPIRGGIARAAAWSYMFKNYAIKDWVAFLENYGTPLRIGKYDNGETVMPQGDIGGASETIVHPREIWWSWGRAANGVAVLVRRYVTVDSDGRASRVVDVGRDGWTVDHGDIDLDTLRVGKLAWQDGAQGSGLAGGDEESEPQVFTAFGLPMPINLQSLPVHSHVGNEARGKALTAVGCWFDLDGGAGLSGTGSNFGGIASDNPPESV